MDPWRHALGLQLPFEEGVDGHRRVAEGALREPGVEGAATTLASNRLGHSTWRRGRLPLHWGGPVPARGCASARCTGARRLLRWHSLGVC